MLSSSPLPTFLKLKLWENILAYRPVAKTWLCKQLPLLCNVSNIHARNNRKTGLCNQLISNGSVKKMESWVERSILETQFLTLFAWHVSHPFTTAFQGLTTETYYEVIYSNPHYHSIVTDLINALSGNSSVSTVQHTTIDKDVFSMSSAPRSGGRTGLCNPLLGNGSVNTFPRIGPCYESGDFINNRDGVFRGVRAEELSWRQLALRVNQFSVGDSNGKFVVEEELEVGLWSLNVWWEDFIYV
jgi:hypothetical protein